MKPTLISVFIAVALIAGSVLLTRQPAQDISPGQNITVVDGVQIIKINANGGYSPRVSTAKANMPTVIRFETNGGFDCSSSIRIPSLNIGQVLNRQGDTDINIGAQTKGSLNGSCAMGMYPFTVNFE